VGQTPGSAADAVVGLVANTDAGTIRNCSGVGASYKCAVPAGYKTNQCGDVK